MTNAAQQEMPTALDNVRVVEIAAGIAVAYTGTLLAQCGAEVIRIEPPSGDEIRRAGPFKDDRPTENGGGLHDFLNGGKRSVALDVTTDSGAHYAAKLIESADILLTNWKTPSSLPLDDPDAFASRFPDTIYVAISEFGRTGPYADYQADSLIHEGMAGMSYVSGKPDREPMGSGVEVADYYAGTTAWIAALAALADSIAGTPHHFVDVSRLECLASADDHNLPVYIGTGAIRRRFYSRVLIMYPSDTFKVKDGYVAFVPAGRDFAGPVSRLIERPDLAEDPLLLKVQERVIRWREFDELVKPWMEEHTKEEVLQRSDELGLAFANVATTKDLVEDPHLAEREFWERLPDGTTVPGPPAKLSETPLQVRPAPDLGEGTAELLELESRAAALLWRGEA